jgi:hypothetical protein
VRYWRASLWLLPLATAVPLGVLVYEVVTNNVSSYDAARRRTELFLQLGVPNLVLLAAAVAGAILGWKGRKLIALLIVGAVCAWQISPLVWSWEFWDPHVRPEYLAVFAVPGAIAGLLGLWGLVQLRNSNLIVALVVGLLLVTPVLSSAYGVVQYRARAAADCPPGPPVDLTFSGLENAHFTSACGIPGVPPASTACTSYSIVGLQLFDWTSWTLAFRPYGRTVTSGEFPQWAPMLTVGSTTEYGGTNGWRGSYTFDPGIGCKGSVDADLFATAGDAQQSVHVSGRFETPP